MISVLRVPWGCDDQVSAIALRRRILRLPLHLDFTPAELALEAGAHHFVAKASGRVVGALYLMPSPDGLSARVRQVCVDPAFRSQGIGRRLHAEAEDYARGLGIRRLRLSARAEAIEFWERLGYRSAGETFLELSIPHLPMEKALNP